MSDVKAMLFRQVPDGRGGFRLEPITTATWLSVPQVATVLGLAAATAYRLIDTGEIPVHRFGGRRMVSAEDLARYIRAARTVAGEALAADADPGDTGHG